jgi:hypothetical protein
MQTCLKFITVDVSYLEPPEPMTVILKHLAQLSHQECLLIKHRRQPFPLYEKLIDAGFLYHCVEHYHNSIELYIYHQKAHDLFNKTIENINIGPY